jgi:hypothetical protein
MHHKKNILCLLSVKQQIPLPHKCLGEKNYRMTAKGFECANALERFSHPSERDVLMESNKMWLSLTLAESTWINCVKDHMQQISPDSYRMMSLFCICHQPVILPYKETPGYRLVCFLPNGCYLLPLFCMPPSLLQSASSSSSSPKDKCGYNEERLLCILLEEVYCKDVGIEQLIKDVEYLYDLSIHRGHIPSSISYLYNRLRKGMPTQLSLVAHLPLHKEIRRSIHHLGQFVLRSCKNNAVSANQCVSKLSTTTIHLTSEEEWNTVVECRKTCGLLLWDKKRVNSIVPMRYASRTTWYWRWRNVAIRYQKRNYRERLDERIQWLAIWLRLIELGEIRMEDSPKHLICLFFFVK